MSKLRTDANTYSLDVEVFIAEVKNYPVIWDFNCKDNRYKNKKQQAWAQVARKFIADFDDLPNFEKMDVYRKLHSKWRNIRDTYVRHIKRREGKRGYIYAPYLSFLNNLYNHVGLSSEDDEGSDEETLPLKKPKKRFDSQNDTWPSDDETPRIENLKRARVRKDADLDQAFDACYQNEDEDRSFFESLLPAVREFSLDQKLEFRSEVISLIKNIRLSVPLPIKLKVDPAEVEFD